MDLNELKNRLEEAWVEYWGLDDSRFHVENSPEFCEEERASILKDLQSQMEEVSLEMDSLEAEIEQRKNVKLDEG